MKLPERIAAARRRANLSQAELAAKLGVSRGTVASWESSGTKHAHGMRRDRIKQVAKVLGVDAAELL